MPNPLSDLIWNCCLILSFELFFLPQNLSFIMLLPVFTLIIFVVAIIKISFRENINELKKALQNVKEIEILKK